MFMKHVTLKTKINRINRPDWNNEIIISKINNSEIVDVRAKIISQDTIMQLTVLTKMKKMISSESTSN